MYRPLTRSVSDLNLYLSFGFGLRRLRVAQRDWSLGVSDVAGIFGYFEGVISSNTLWPKVFETNKPKPEIAERDLQGFRGAPRAFVRFDYGMSVLGS